MSQVAVDVAGIVENAQPRSEDVLALRTALCQDASVRKQATYYVASLPSDDAAGEADKKLAVKKGLALWVVGRERDAALWLRHSTAKIAIEFLGRSLLATGRPGEAAELLADHADDADLAAVVADAYAQQGDADACAKAAKKVGSDAEKAYLEGRVLDLQGDRTGASAAYRKALELDEEHARALFRLAHVESLYGDEEEALDLYRRCIDTPCPPVNAYLNLGNLYEDRGEFTRARECYKVVIDADPRNVRARMFMKDASASMNMFYDEDMERRADRRSQVMRLPVTDFELSVRSRNCLAKMGVRTLGDLIQRTEAELLSYKNFGETSLQEIKDILAQKGLRLGMAREEFSRDDEARSILEGIGGGEAGDPAMLQRPLSDLELSVRSRHCMGVLGLKTVGDLCNRSEAELMTIKNFGQTSLNEVKQKLAELGLSLANG
jgi:DNA-directed RNA polymerase subunit alpha